MSVGECLGACVCMRELAHVCGCVGVCIVHVCGGMCVGACLRVF